MKSPTALATGGIHRMADGRWRFSITLGYDGSGRQIRKAVTARTKSELIPKRDALLKQLESGSRQCGKITVETWMTTWIDDIAYDDLSPRVRHDYRGKIRRYIVPSLGKYRLSEIGPDEIRELHAHVYGHGVSSRTVQIVHSILNCALRDAVREGHLASNPCERVGRPRARSTSRTPLTADQSRRVILTAVEAEDPLASMWTAALLLGARQGELIGLEWSRVDLDAGTIDLAWQAQRLPWAHGFGCSCLVNTPAKKCPARIYDAPKDYEVRSLNLGLAWVRPKTQTSIRLMPIPQVLREQLLQHRRLSEGNQWGLVWCGVDGRPLRSRDVTEAWKRALSRADVPPVDMHSARHTTASLLLESGVATEVIVQMLGHSSVLSTRTYLHVDRGMAQAAAERLGSRIFGGA